MSEERLWKFSKPEWLTSVYARNAGVYASGALVSVFEEEEDEVACCYPRLFVFHGIVFYPIHGHAHSRYTSSQPPIHSGTRITPPPPPKRSRC